MTTTKKKFVLRIPIRKLREAKEKKNEMNANEANDTDTASNTTVPSPLASRSIDHNLSAANDSNDSDDMHDFHGIHDAHIPALTKQLSNNDIYTDNEDELHDHENNKNGRKLKLKSAFLSDNDEFLNLSESEQDKQATHSSSDDSDDEQTAHDIKMKIHNEEIERLRKQKENELRIVDREYESIMKEMRGASSSLKPIDCDSVDVLPANQLLKIERQKEIEMIHINDENHWIQNEKHAISMRHISIRDDKRRVLQSFISQTLLNNQFRFIKMNLETYFKLQQHQIEDHLFINIERLQLAQLFNCHLSTEIQQRITALIDKFEQYLMEKYIEIHKTEKSVTFAMDSYERDCASVKNKLESCPVLYILLMNKEISFDALLSADMISVCLMCMNSVIRKKIQRKLESLVKKDNARAVEMLLFKHWESQRLLFKANVNKTNEIKPEPETKTNTETVSTENKTNGDRTENENQDEDVQVIEVKSRILHDKYPLFCQKYLRFLMSFPNYRNLVVSNHKEMSKIFAFTAEQLINPPQVEGKKKSATANVQNTKKRKHFGGIANNSAFASAPCPKRRKLSPDNNNTHNHSKERVIWDGTLVNDAVKCRVKMKQIGGKSIWTLPFKLKSTQQLQKLSITGRINIISIIKFIKQLRKHKTRRIIFAEIESNEYVHHNSYNALCSALRNSNRAGVIDFEKQCGILIYIISSSCLSPSHAVSHQLNKYFDGHKAKTPKTKIFSIIILSLDVYNQVKRKMPKGIPTTNSANYTTNRHHHNNGNKSQYHKKPAQPPKPQTQPHKSAAGAPPQPPKPPPNISKSKEGGEETASVKNVDDIWDEIGNEIAIEDDLGELPPPLPAHLLAERERYKQQIPAIIPPPLPPHSNNNRVMQAPAPPQLPMPHNQGVVYPIGQQMIYPQITVQPPTQPPPVPRQIYGVQYPHPPPHYG